MNAIRAFGRFWYVFIVGDDWRIAAGVAAVLLVGAVAVAAGLGSPALAVALLVGLVAVFAVPIIAMGG